MRATQFFLVLLGFVLTGTASYGQKNIYESRRFDELTADHQVLAIVPFLTQLNLKEKISTEDNRQLAEREGYAVQDALEGYFSRRKKKKRFNVAFQNTKNTNAILAQNNITYANIDVFTTKQLAAILGVDGIISGSIDLNILLSKGVSTEFSFFDYFNEDSDYGRIGIKISDGPTGKLLWRYEKEINKKTGKNTSELIDRMMKLAAKKFPYDKERKRKKKK